MYNKEHLFKQLKNLKLQYQRIIKIHGEDINEETIKVNIVKKFLTIIGYNEDYFYFELVLGNKDRVDMAIKNIKTLVEVLYVEVKKVRHKFTDDDFTQLANYLNANNINWGILTNGKTYILFNQLVNGKANEKFILTFNLFNNELKNDFIISNSRNINNLKLLSYDYLINDSKSNYFIQLANFRNTFQNEHSFRQYESTLYNYLNYLADNTTYNLTNINPDTFKKFLIKDFKFSSVNNKKTNHRETIINKFSHVNSFYTKVIEPMEKRNPFKILTQTDFLNDILGYHHDLKEKEAIHAPSITIEELNMLFKTLDNNRHSLRNKVILLFFIYAGLDKKDLCNLKIKDININSMKLTLANRTLPIPIHFKGILEEYLKERKSINTNCDYLFCGGKYNEKHTKISDSTMNTIINDQFNSLNICEGRKKILNTSFIKRSLIKDMFNNQIPLQEIAKFTGLSLSSLEEYITKDDIEKVKLNKVLKKHPYNEMFDSL
ncbi:tyrosine-type recombinase/integrase [Clostridium sp. 001]|uniref:tyrosine-type recombinase/integrase n=1 Tax=Clostridium sp. 001 TaxID=1970093 RepID=UPI001C2CA861|nr:tyrosine-type recombinase/integrase [Clostridium sp. 001]QXE20018.1 hypothetical protein B5S50_14960 [Clostridium sp. 001]